MELGITFCSDASCKLQAFKDPSFASHSDDRQGALCAVAILCGGLILWFSRTHRIIPLSRTEADSLAVVEAAKTRCSLGKC